MPLASTLCSVILYLYYALHVVHLFVYLSALSAVSRPRNLSTSLMLRISNTRAGWINTVPLMGDEDSEPWDV